LSKYTDEYGNSDILFSVSKISSIYIINNPFGNDIHLLLKRDQYKLIEEHFTLPSLIPSEWQHKIQT